MLLDVLKDYHMVCDNFLRKLVDTDAQPHPEPVRSTMHNAVHVRPGGRNLSNGGKMEDAISVRPAGLIWSWRMQYYFGPGDCFIARWHPPGGIVGPLYHEL